jgi:hypothetical protein
VRTITVTEAEVRVEDRLDGSGEYAVESSLPLGDGDVGGIAALGAAAAREPRPVAERLYERRDGEALVVRARLALPAELGWRCQRRGPATIGP